MGYSLTLQEHRRSKKNRKRAHNDFYPTPEEVVRAILLPYRDHPWGERPMVLDPGAGLGSFGKVFRELRPKARIVGIDNHWPQRPPEYDLWLHRDFIGPQNHTLHDKFDIVIGNPPYGVAQRFVEESLKCLRPFGICVMLLRLAFLESSGRKEFFERIPLCSVSVLSRRPSFDGSGHTDATAYAVFMWIKWPDSAIRERISAPTLGWIDWKTDAYQDN